MQTYYTKPPYMLSANTAWLVPEHDARTAERRSFRKALAMSINVDQIVKADYGNIVAKANPTGLLPTWNKWIDQGQASKLGFKYNIAGAKALLAANGYKDTNGDGYVENKAGQSVNLRLIVPDGWSDWMTAIQIIAASAKDAGIKITPAYPDYNGLVDERNSGKFDLVIKTTSSSARRPTPTTTTSSTCRWRTRRRSRTTRGSRGGAEAVGTDPRAQQGEPRERGGGEEDRLADPEVHPRGSACDPALVQRLVVAVQHDVLEELPDLERPAVHAERLERIHQHDGYRRARPPAGAEEVTQPVARCPWTRRRSPGGERRPVLRPVTC